MDHDREVTAEGVALTDAERQRCEIWTRVMGYYRPVSMWNAGKQSEYFDRKPFREPPVAWQDPTGQKKLEL